MDDDRSGPSPSPNSHDVVTASTLVQVRWHPADGGNLSVVTRARGWLRRALPRLAGRRLTRAIYDDTELLLSELVTNAVRHGGGVVAVRLRIIGKVLRVTVCDHTAAAPVIGRADTSSEHGRGIFLVDALATRWGVHRRRACAGKCVWLELSTAVT